MRIVQMCTYKNAPLPVIEKLEGKVSQIFLG